MKLRKEYPHIAVGQLCGLFGKTRHAYYDHKWRSDNVALQNEIIVQLVIEIRLSLPGTGTRKLHYLLAPKLKNHAIFIGRDQLFALLDHHKLLIRKRRRKAVTTDSRHWMRKYPNLIAELEIQEPEQVWVSDITYIRLTNEFAYLSLITDAYSRKIMGFCLCRDLSAEGCISALKMALNNRLYKRRALIHHSDRGSQYCCKDYVEILTDHKIAVSMTENGSPYENAMAERVNGILKSEFNLYHSSVALEQTQKLIAGRIQSYNTLRPHASCDYLTPEQAHGTSGNLNKRWKKNSKINVYS